MLRFEQLEFFSGAPAAAAPISRGRDFALEAQARELSRKLGARNLAPLVRVEWSGRLRSTAGRADYRHKLITLNPRLHEHGAAEIDRTFRHELAHLVAQSRAGRRRIPPHGRLWREACRELGIGDEKPCHSLPFPVVRRERRFLYHCPRCARDFPRVRRIHRRIACLACCREYNRGQYDEQFRLRLVGAPQGR